jgi:hypothetical protein
MKKHRLDEWICMDCSFQGNCASDLIKHLKVTSHQPSQNSEDKRKVFQDYRQCYTCKMDFDGFFNLMKHRKSVHPSSKKCRNFPGICTFDKDCWYVHDEKLDTEDKVNHFKCDSCGEEFKGRNIFMKHRKASHPEKVSSCDKFSKRQCPRPDQECWFEHKPTEQNHDPEPPTQEKTNKKQDFCEALGNAFPPDQMNQMNMFNSLIEKVERIEKKFESLTK